MTVTGTETAECDKWAEIVALAQQGNKKMLGVILQAFDIKLRKIAHTSAYKGFAEAVSYTHLTLPTSDLV